MTAYCITDAIYDVADDVILQLTTGDAAARTCRAQCADGSYRDSLRIFYADLPNCWHDEIPAGVVRVAIDLDPVHARNPAHEVRVYFDSPAAKGLADAIAAAVLEQIDSTADYAR